MVGKNLVPKKPMKASIKTSYEAISPGFPYSRYLRIKIKPREIEEIVVDETARVEENVTVPEPMAVEEVEEVREAAVEGVKEIVAEEVEEKAKERRETSLFLGVIIMVLIIVAGIFLYILILAKPKTKRRLGNL